MVYCVQHQFVGVVVVRLKHSLSTTLKKKKHKLQVSGNKGLRKLFSSDKDNVGYKDDQIKENEMDEARSRHWE
jgi:hypothetical protein